jgi:hypothetical protein
MSNTIRKMFWRKIEETWLNGDVKTVAQMITHVIKRKTTANDVKVVRKFLKI